MPSREPSVSSLADALSRTTAQRAEPRVAIARPPNLVRVLIAAVLVMTLLFLAALLALGMRTSALVEEVRLARQQREEHDYRAVPSEAVLRHADATRREVLMRPLAAGPIWQARCAWLAREGDWAGLEATCASLALDAPAALLPGTRLLQTEALLRLGRPEDSRRVLAAIDQTRLDAAGRAQAADLAGRLWLVERPAKQVRQPAPEGADQLDPR